jgi:hypothetical protein
MTLLNTDLRQRVAENLRVKAVDRDLADEDAEKIDNAIDDVFAELRELGLLWWADDAIPQACAFALTLIVSAQACARFGKIGQGYEGGDADGRARLAALKPSAVIETAQAVYY